MVLLRVYPSCSFVDFFKANNFLFSKCYKYSQGVVRRHHLRVWLNHIFFKFLVFIFEKKNLKLIFFSVFLCTNVKNEKQIMKYIYFWCILMWKTLWKTTSIIFTNRLLGGNPKVIYYWGFDGFLRKKFCVCVTV